MIDKFLNLANVNDNYFRSFLKQKYKQIYNSYNTKLVDKELKSLVATSIFYLPQSNNDIKQILRRLYFLSLDDLKELYKTVSNDYIQQKFTMPKLETIKQNYLKQKKSTKVPGKVKVASNLPKKMFNSVNFVRQSKVNTYLQNALGLLGINNIDPRNLSNENRTLLVNIAMNYKNNPNMNIKSRIPANSKLTYRNIDNLNTNTTNANRFITRSVKNMEITQKQYKEPIKLNKKTKQGLYIYVLFDSKIYLIPIPNIYEPYGKHANIVEYLQTNSITAAGELQIQNNTIIYNLFSGTYMVSVPSRQKLMYERYRKEAVKNAIEKLTNKQATFVRKSLLNKVSVSNSLNLSEYRNFINFRKLNT